MKRLAWILLAAAWLPLACSHPKELTLEEGAGWTSRRNYADFVLTGQARTEEGAAAAIRFCESGPGTGYEVLLQNGPIDGTVRTGSLRRKPASRPVPALARPGRGKQALKRQT